MRAPADVRILLVEDDYVIATDLSVSLEKLGYRVLPPVDSGEAALAALPDAAPDLILLDVDLAGDLDGIETAHALRRHTDAPVLFLTALSGEETLRRARYADPNAFLVKPVKLADLRSAIELALHRTRQPAPPAAPAAGESIFVRTRQRLEKVRLSDILWVSAADVYATLHTTHGQYLLSYPLKTAAARLPADRFVRVHRSHVVNLDRVEALEENHLFVADERLPIGRTYRDELLRRLDIR